MHVRNCKRCRKHFAWKPGPLDWVNQCERCSWGDSKPTGETVLATVVFGILLATLGVITVGSLYLAAKWVLAGGAA